MLHGDALAGQRGGNDTLDGGAAGTTGCTAGRAPIPSAGATGRTPRPGRTRDAGVVVRLHSAAARGGHAEGDTFARFLTIEYTDADRNAQSGQVPDIEHLHGSAHNDTLAGGTAGTTPCSGARRGRYPLRRAGAGAMTPSSGEAGDDALYGGRGNDTLYGNAGDDTLVGGPRR